MSSYTAKFKRKDTGEVTEVFCLDDYFGSHEYGYQVPNGTIYREKEFYELYGRIA